MSVDEFNCVECGRHIVRFGNAYVGQPKICFACIFLPHWFHSKEIQEVIDPDFDFALVPEHEREET